MSTDRKINEENGLDGDQDFAFNIFELDAASNNSVDDIRNLIDQVRIPPQTGQFKVYIIDEVHMLSSAAFNAFLKTLEEPNEGIYIVLVTPHPYLVPQTIRSRVRLILGNTEMEIPDYLSSKKVLLEYVKEVFGKESEEDASTRRAQATVLLDNIEHKVKDDPEKLKAVYEAKDMLFKANMPTKQVMEYLVAMIF